jgi:TP901 family phage tail tape measure protein
MSNNVHLGVEIKINGLQDLEKLKKMMDEMSNKTRQQTKATKDLNVEQKKNNEEVKKEFQQNERKIKQRKELTDLERKAIFIEQQRRSELRKTWKAEMDHRNVFQKFAQSRIGQFVAPIATAATFRKILNDTKEFDKLTRKIQGVIHATEADMKVLNKKSLEVAAKYGISSMELQHDVFNLTKTWNHGNGKILTHLEAIVKAAIGTNSTVSDTASVYSNIENTFGDKLNPEQLANAVAFLGDAVGSTMVDIDYALTNSIMSAKAHKVELKELSAMIGVLSMSGAKGATGGTAVKQIITALTNPKIEKHLKLMGLTFKDVNIDQIGFTKSIDNLSKGVERLKKKKGGDVLLQGAMRAMFGEAEGKVQSLISNQKQYQGFVKQFEGFNAGKITAEQLKSLSVKMKQAEEGLSQLGLNIGIHLMPVLVNMIDGANFLFDVMTEAGKWVSSAFEKFTSGLGDTGKLFAVGINLIVKRAEAAMIGGIIGFFIGGRAGAAAGGDDGVPQQQGHGRT